MHELSLSAYLPNQSLNHILRVLSAVTGMPPSPVLEHHLLFKPKSKRSAGVSAATGGGSVPGGSASSVSDLYFLKLVADLRNEEEKFKKETLGDGDNEEGNVNSVNIENNGVNKYTYDVREQSWSIRFSDLPEVSGKRPVTSRLILNADIGEGDALAFVDSLGYTPECESIVSGFFFIHNSIQITVTSILLPREPFTVFPLPNNTTPLDPANAYIVQASIKVASSNEQESMNKAIEELKQFKAEMKGVIDLEISDRLSLDTRVR